MAANGRGNMRPAGRSPPFLAIGLFVALVILGFNYWSLSSRNGEQSNEIVLLESELRLVNAKKTSAEKRSEAISDKVTELESQINNQKEVIAKSEADRANLEKDRQGTLERINELENEVRGIKDQQLPACETDKKNLQQEVEQLRADIEVHKNKECGRSDCEAFINKEKDGLIEDMYKVVGSLPLVSMYRSNIKLGSYQDQIARLAAQLDEEALKKKEQQPQQGLGNQQQGFVNQQQQQQVPVDQQQQQQAPVDQQQQQQVPVDQQQQQQVPVDQQQQQQAPGDQQQQQQVPVVNLDQQSPLGTQQLQQQAPVDGQQQAPVDGQQQQAPVDGQQQQAPIDGQQQAPIDGQQQQAPVDQQQQQQVGDVGAQPVDQSQQGVGPAPVSNQDPTVDETKIETSLNNDVDTAKAMDTDRLLNAGQGVANQSAADDDGVKTSTKTTVGTTTKPGIKNDIPPNTLNAAVVPGQPLDTYKPLQPHTGDGNIPADVGAAADNGADDDYDADDDDNAAADRDDTLRVNKGDQDYDYDDADDDDDGDDENDDYDYDKKTDDLKRDENGIDTMFQNDKRAAQSP